MYHERTGTLTPDDILQELRGLLQGETDGVATLANAASLLFLHLQNINWLGFYVLRHGELVLGPFQGKPACTRIAVGRGVCGTACASGETLVVDDVELFPGHIACDPASRSEIVVPLRAHGELVGVLDCDAPARSRFGRAERDLFVAAATLIGDHLTRSDATL
jgi:GAF domain-containing protein